MTPIEIQFYPIDIGDPAGGEEAVLGLANGRLVAVLIRIALKGSEDHGGFYLEVGFGPCAREGLLFASLQAAESWINHRFSQDSADRVNRQQSLNCEPPATPSLNPFVPDAGLGRAVQ